MRRLLVSAVVLSTSSPWPVRGAAATATPSAWVGTYTLGGQDDLAVTLSGKQALVALGAGHADAQSVPLSTAKRTHPVPASGPAGAGRLRRRHGRRPAQRHGPAGRRPRHVHRAPGAGAQPPRPRALPGSGGIEAVVDDPYGPARLVDLDSGRVRALYPAGAAFAIGSGFATRAPATGAASFGARSARIDGQAAQRLRVRQLEVRFRSGAATLAGTLLAPARRGKHAGGRVRARLRARRSGPTSPTSRPCCSATVSPCSTTTSAASASRRVPIPASRRRRPRSTRSRATPRLRRGSSPRSPRSTAPASGSRARARPAGSRRSPRRARPRSGSSSSSPGRR